MKKILFAFVLLWAVTSHSAELTVADFLNIRQSYPERVEMYLYSVLLAYNEREASLPAGKREFCPPAKLAEKLNTVNFMDGFLATTPGLEEFDLGNIFVVALKERYPCKH